MENIWEVFSIVNAWEIFNLLETDKPDKKKNSMGLWGLRFVVAGLDLIPFTGPKIRQWTLTKLTSAQFSVFPITYTG